VYDRQQGLNMKLKEFTVEHVRHWEPALFLDLVSDWSLIGSNLQDFCDSESMLVEVTEISYTSRESAAEKQKKTNKRYVTCSKFLQ
jgi:hypothetical protein